MALKFAAASADSVIDLQRYEPLDLQVAIVEYLLLHEGGGAVIIVVDGYGVLLVTDWRLYEVVALIEFGIDERN